MSEDKFKKKELFLTQLGERIVCKRKQRGISQKELAEIVNINPTALRRIEKGVVSTSAYQIKQLCDALEISFCTVLDFGCPVSEDCKRV